MNKFLLASISMICASSFTASAADFDGFYIGASAGLMQGHITSTAAGSSVTLGNDSPTANVGLLAGAGKLFGNAYLGGEANWHNNQGEVSGTLSGVAFSAKTKSALSLSVIPGYLISRETMLYTRLGKGTIDTDNGTSKDNFDTLTYGIGISHSITRSTSIRAEYKVVSGDKNINGLMAQTAKLVATVLMLRFKQGFNITLAN